MASEGLNGTCCGTIEATEAYMNGLRADPRFSNIEFKVDRAETNAFRKLFVRVRDEIITLGPNENPVGVEPGRYAEAEEFKAALHDPNAIILDGRNAYESDIGKFEGAICPPVENFRELPEWIRENLADAKDKPIYTYCTGGIRCEKLTAWMRREGFSNVTQLRGGIVAYGYNENTLGEGFEGECYVFDERISTPVNRTGKAIAIATCRFCGCSSSRYINCANVECNLQYVCCEQCERGTSHSCSSECASAPRKRLSGRKLSESLTLSG